MKLRAKYDDGFVAWINGVPVAVANAPQTLDWNSPAIVRSDTADALKFEEFNLNDWRSFLQEGTNILALQGLNFGATNTDFLLLPELEADYAGVYSSGGNYLVVPTPGGSQRLRCGCARPCHFPGWPLAVPSPQQTIASPSPVVCHKCSRRWLRLLSIGA